MYRIFIFLLIFLCSRGLVVAQQAVIMGKVTSFQTGNPLPEANIFLSGTSLGTNTDSLGRYRLSVPANRQITIVFRFVGYDSIFFDLQLNENETRTLNTSLREAVQVLKTVNIVSESTRRESSVVTISPRSAGVLPSPFGDFTKILTMLPGVVSNSELSTGYSVRGGNFDENLVYVNGIRIYRPFLARAGRQEGLSFVNTDLVKEARFYAGGWQSNFGNKLSSVLDVTYKIPDKIKGSVTLGLLGGSAYLEGATSERRLQYLIGARHKRAQYLLNTLDVNGEFIPTFTDIQTYVNLNAGKQHPEQTQIGLLFSYAQNRYQVIPKTRETEFGTFSSALRFLVAFEGQESLNYDTWQSGISLLHRLSNDFSIKFTVSGVKSFEKEYSDVEGGYRLCDVDKNPASSSFNECVSIRGIGTEFFHARNTLESTLLMADVKGGYALNSKNYFEFGLDYSFNDFDDYLEEYAFVDSADFSEIKNQVLITNQTVANMTGGFVQHSVRTGQSGELVYGFRFSYRDMNKQWLFSPRMQYSLQPAWNSDYVFKAAVGLYQQQPLYRELRNFNGVVNRNVKAQQSLHVIAGLDHNFLFWLRPFKWTAELYYKYLWDVIPYDVDNIRIRYYGENLAVAYAAGMDIRISGEFIPGTESWFSLGLLTTREDLSNDERGFVRRPSDQHLTVSVFFEDHLPDNPSMRVNLGFIYGSGLPFGPPGNLENRSVFNGDSYQRVDIGFSKIFFLTRASRLESIWLSLEVLNLFGIENTISYTWIQELSGNFIAVPNTLTNRFFNIKLTFRFE
ncbi:MAG: TonB-dependent receptor [Bacteroidetes bacterium]|nr:TonB-dependent receptor [Bacteroidota bacterium]